MLTWSWSVVWRFVEPLRTLGLATISIFLFPFLLKKTLICPLLAGETQFSSVPPSNSIVSVSDPWRALWANTAAFKRPLTRLMRYFWNYRDTRTSSGAATLGATSISSQRKLRLCSCWKCTFLHRYLIVNSQQNRIELVTRSGGP